MKNKTVSPSTSQPAALPTRGARRPWAALFVFLALVAFASSSALADQCAPAEFSESGTFPGTVYVYVTTTTPGATIFATMGNHYIPLNPTHSGSSPTGTTFICGGTFAVFPGDYKHFKAVVYKAGMSDSFMTSYEVDNSGN